MRLAILDSGHGAATRALFGVIRLASRHPVLDVIKLVKYRPDFYGKPMGVVTQQVMRGPSAWSVGDRELMAAVVAQANACPFCIEAHAAVARAAYKDDARVASVLRDLDSADLEPRLHVTLQLLRKLVAQRSLAPDDFRAVLDRGVTRDALEEALAVAFAFNTITRLANAFGFAQPTREAMDAGAKFLLSRGYG